MERELKIGTAVARRGEKVWGEIPVSGTYAADIRSPWVAVVRGLAEGPTVYVGAGTHGDEFNSIEAVRRVAFSLDPVAITGNVVLVPVQNRAAFEAHSRHTPADNKDLDSSYPGERSGSPTEALAYTLFNEAIVKADYAMDLHTAARGGWNLIHAMTAPERPKAAFESQRIARLFGVRVLVALEKPSEGYLGKSIGWDLTGSLFVQTSAAGVPCPIIEFGEGGRLEPDQVDLGIQGIINVLAGLGALDRPTVSHTPPFLARGAVAVRCQGTGFLYHEVRPGQEIKKNRLLARIVTFPDRYEEITSPCDGVVVRIATNGMVSPDERVAVVATS
jgi:predicted deacylase